jgi:transcriptional regulator GlxA family with amidase domain
MSNDHILRLTPIDWKSIDEAISYVRSHYKNKISADQLSIEVNLNKEKLQAGFRQKTKLSLHQFILCVRIEKAKDLLANTNSPLKSIAIITGFNDDSHFCKVFRKLTTITPIEYRFQQVV